MVSKYIVNKIISIPIHVSDTQNTIIWCSPLVENFQSEHQLE